MFDLSAGDDTTDLRFNKTRCDITGTF